MTSVIGALLIVVALEAAVIAALLVQRTRHARAERAVRESEERLRHMVDRTPAMLWTVRPDTTPTLDFINRTCAEFTGLPLEKLREEGWLGAVHPDDLDDLVGAYVRAFEARTAFLLDYRLRRADGAYRWLLATGVPKYGPDGSFAGYVGCDVDITERRDAEDRMRESRAALEISHREIQKLAGRLIEAQDAERARVARDLHDDVSQQLAGLSIALSSLKHRMNGLHVSEDLLADLRALHQRTSTLAQNVRHLSHDLHPTVLRHAGLVAALTSYCAELERSHGTVLTCSAEGDSGSIAPEIALCLYRIAQEALRNVVAHAGASRADVRLFRTGDDAELTIVDDGKGFDLAATLQRGKGLGLVSIMERVRLAGGTVSLLVVSAYIALRFEWKYAVPVVIALMHDLLLTGGVYSLTGREVTTSTVAALLTLLGFSLYDTIIVFDRIRENVPRMPRAAFSQIVNRSMSEVIVRSVATSVSTGLPILGLLLFGGETLKDFAFALLVGTVSGTYSSIFIAGPVLTHWKEREPVYRRRRERIAAENGGVVPAYAVAGAAVDVAPVEKKRPARRLTTPDDPDQGVSKDEFEDMVRDLHVEEPAPTPATARELDPTADAAPEDLVMKDDKPKREKQRRPRNKRHGRAR